MAKTQPIKHLMGTFILKCFGGRAETCYSWVGILFSQPGLARLHCEPLMRTLLILIGVCSVLLLKLSMISDSAIQTDQMYFEGTPQINAFTSTHPDRMDRLAEHWSIARALAIASALASISCLALSFRKKAYLPSNPASSKASL